MISRFLRDGSGLLLIIVALSCCKTDLDYDKFKAASLPEQMRMYNDEAHNGCITHPATYLFLISEHGTAAADAAAAELPPAKSTFPIDDAIEIIHFVNAGGVDLRNHEALRRLEELSRSSPDPAVRRRSGEVVAEIREHRQ